MPRPHAVRERLPRGDGGKSEPGGAGVRLLLVHEENEGDGLARLPRREVRRAAVTARAPRVHVHLPMQAHMNTAMIRGS